MYEYSYTFTPSLSFCLSHGGTAPRGQGLFIIEALQSRSDKPRSVGLLWTSDQPDAETYYLNIF
jgi:hypothetical protein